MCTVGLWLTLCDCVMQSTTEAGSAEGAGAAGGDATRAAGAGGAGAGAGSAAKASLLQKLLSQ